MPSRPAIATISISASQPAIHSAAFVFDGVRSMEGEIRAVLAGTPVSASARRFATSNSVMLRCAQVDFAVGVTG